MNIKPFKIERYFARYEFSAPFLLSCSDCEPLTLNEVLSLCDAETKELWENLWLGYTESQGHLLLRKEIAKLYQNISPQKVLVVTPIEGIFITMHTLLTKGDHAIVAFPGYQALYEVAQSIGCEATNWTIEDRESGWHFDIAKLKDSIKHNTKLIIINFPHNPTGTLISREEFSEIVDLARKNNIVLFSDEMYRFLEYDPNNRLPSASDEYEDAISLSGMSKTFGLPGLRIGWLTTNNNDLFKKLATFKDYTSICSSAPSEILALIGLRAKETIIARNLKIIKNNLMILDRFFEKHASMVSWHRPRAGSVAFPKLRAAKQISGVAQESVETKGVMIIPSDVFDYPGNYFRVGFGRKNFPEALAKFEEFITESFLQI